MIKETKSFLPDISNPQFRVAEQMINETSQSVFLTGKAGTGKTTFLKHICATTKKKFVVLAPTGIAAINAGGVTLHSFFKLPFRPLLPDDPDLSLTRGRIFESFKYNKEQKKIIKELDLIIIDEISMVRADIIDCIDKLLRVYSGRKRLPFGGKQLLFIGDLFQLEPVVKNDERDILDRFYVNPFFFSAHVFKDIELVPIELTKVYRQQDLQFIELLDRVRINQMRNSDLDLLNTRCIPKFETSPDDLYITLATRRDQVDYINDQKLKQIDEKQYDFEGIVEGDFADSQLPTLKVLSLKVGAQVLFIENDRDHRWVNGTIGTVSFIDEDNLDVYVLLEDGSEHVVDRSVWHNCRYKYNEEERKIEEEILGSFSQLPLKLAWAITVHKSQGMTFHHVIIDFSGGVFAGGQSYVALSRCTSLEGMVLRRPISFRDVFIHPSIVKFSKKYNDPTLIKDSLERAEAEQMYLRALHCFKINAYEQALDLFFAAKSKLDLTNDLVIQRFIRRKMRKISHLQNQVEDFRKQLQSSKELMNDLAHEFYLMGNSCVVEAQDNRAALRNFDKALKLNPHHLDALVRKGVTLMNMGNCDDALSILDKAIQLYPESFKANYQRGKCLMILKKYELAEDSLLSALKIKAEHIALNLALSEVYHYLGHPKLSLKFKNRAEDLKNKNRI